MNTRIALALTSVICCSQVVVADDSYQEAVDKHLQPLLDAELIPGAVVGVYKDGKESYYTIGKLAFDAKDSPSFDTLYEIGSISKVMTGVLFADAIRRGEVTKHTPVDDLLPDGVDSKDYDGTEVELWHLTTHSSGWPTSPVNLKPKDPDQPYEGYNKEQLWEFISKAKPKFEPGTSFEYSNLAVGLLGTLVADNAGESYEDLVIERVFEPLGIEDIQITLDEDDLDRLAPGSAGGRPSPRWNSMGVLDPAGMWIASAPSLLKFAIENLNEGEGAIYESLEAAREPMQDSGFGKVCFGWMLALDGSTYWHNGKTGGYSSYMATNPTIQTAIVVLTNGATLQTTAAGERIFQQIVGLNPDPIQIETYEPIDPDHSARLVGSYHSMFFDMEITEERGRLFARITNQTALMIVPTDEPNRFRYAGVDAEIVFDLPEEGDATRVTLHQNGREYPCDRVEE
jgi:CubicO group peptidase (beta-lactamase class C family)